MNSSFDNHETQPPVTVVIPAYNLILYLADAVNSVLQQRYSGAITLVILDDGSTDETYQLACQMAEGVPNVKVYTQENKGRVGARNRLIELAETELIAWLDGDDIASPDWIEDQVALLKKQPECVAVSGQHYTITPDGKALGPVHVSTKSDEIEQNLINGQFGAFFQSGALIKKSALLKVGSYSEDFPSAEDYYLWLRLLDAGVLVNSNHYNIYYRVHQSSACWTDGTIVSHVWEALNFVRANRGLEPLTCPENQSMAGKTWDWNRRIYWINIALRSGNPLSAFELIIPAVRQYPQSLLIWIFLFVAVFDSILFLGNKTKKLSPGHQAEIKTLPAISLYRLGRWMIRMKRKLRGS